MQQLWALAALACAAVGIVQPAGPDAPAAPTPTPAILAAGTPVDIEITQPLSSKDNKTGARFGIRLAEPVLYRGVVVLPVGATGEGEVVDAKKAGMAGKPGYLILAARYVDENGVRIPLKAMKLGRTGENKGNEAMVIAIAGGAAGSVVAVFIQGGEVVIPAGTHASAKLATDIDVASLPRTDLPAAVTPSPTPLMQQGSQP